MVDAGANILEEAMAIRASDIDVIWRNGYRCGPVDWAEEVGLDKLLAGSKRMEVERGR